MVSHGAATRVHRVGTTAHITHRDVQHHWTSGRRGARRAIRNPLEARQWRNPPPSATHPCGKNARLQEQLGA
eukprot:1964778-Alexandrium_andersonii.AAC.1